MKQKDGGGGGSSTQPLPPGQAAASGGGGGGGSGKRQKKVKGRFFTLTTGPLPQPKFKAIVSAIYQRKQAEADDLRREIMRNARRAEKEALQSPPTVLETGLDALEDFDAFGLRRKDRSPRKMKKAQHPQQQREKEEEGGQAEAAAAAREGEGGGESSDGGGPARKRQKTMADVVKLHRRLSELQKSRTELRWLLEQVERLEYEAL